MRQFLVIISNIIIVISIAAGVVNYANKQHVSSAEAAEQAFLNTSEVVSGVADNYLLDTQTICSSWANYINANDMTMEEAINYLGKTKAVEAISAHLIWKDTLQGLSITERISRPGDHRADYSGKLADIFEDISIEDGVGITARYNDPMTGDYVMSFCRSVYLSYDIGVKKEAILMCVVPISYLEERWVFPSDYTDAAVALIKKNGEYILKPNSMKNDSFFSYLYYYNRGTIDQNELADLVASEDFGYFYGYDAEGRDCIWVFRSLKREDRWSIVVSLPREAIQGTPTDWFISGIIILGLALILFIDIGYFLVLIHRNRKSQRQLKIQAVELQDALNSERENKSIVQGISHEYDSLWTVKVPGMEMDLVQENTGGRASAFKETVKEHSYYSNIMQQYADRFVYDEDKAYFLEACDYDTVKHQMQDQNVFSVSYRRLINGAIEYHQLSFASTGTDSSFVVGFRDINDLMKEKQRQADELAAALTAAEYANRAKTIFLNSMSHDIRTPMNAIIGFTNLAEANIGNQELVKNYLSKISLSSEYLLSLINDVLDMSRIESGKMTVEEKEMHLPDLLHELMAIIQENVKAKNLKLSADTLNVYHEDIITDKLRLNRVLLNIIGNAIKFTNPGGMISVRIIEKSNAPKGYASYEFRIKDTGIGMTKEFKEHIFESFSREESTTVSGIQGSGLGMAITKKFVDLMGGTITVESELNVGTEFVVEFQFRIPDKVVDNKELLKLQGYRALVADPDFHVCASEAMMLKDMGLRAEWAATGEEAVSRTELSMKIGGGFQVYIIAHRMKDMDGIELIRRIREIMGGRKPVIIMTAFDWSEIKEEAIEAGVTSFCSKPVFMSELRNALTVPYKATKETSAEQIPDFTGKRILLVEDNELNQEIAAAILQNAGFLVDIASDGAEAVDIMRSESAKRYDLILMDIQMPRMNGYESTRQIRSLPDAEIAKIPIIAMTANAFDEDKKLAEEAGMNGHIAKPIDVKKLFGVLEEILGGRG